MLNGIVDLYSVDTAVVIRGGSIRQITYPHSAKRLYSRFSAIDRHDHDSQGITLKLNRVIAELTKSPNLIKKPHSR